MKLFSSEPLEFIKGTLRNPAAVGSIFPSSKYLSREFTRYVRMDEDDVVVELGPGTGPITEHLYDWLESPGDQYIGIETDAGYVDVLRERFPEMSFEQGSAADTLEFLNAHEVEPERVKLIASALPFATLPDPVQDEIYEDIDRLMTPGTWFRTVQLAHAWPMESARRFRGRMERRFGQMERSRLVVRNLPPAYVLTWRG